MSIPVFHSYGDWGLSGVNTWTVNMVRGSKHSKFEHRVLFTGISPHAKPELDELGIPYEFLELLAKRTRRQEWRELKRFLEDRSPCIYIPNYDFHRSCAVGTLAKSVKVCAVIHSDEHCYFDEVRRLGRNFDVIVAVSRLLSEKLGKEFPSLKSRVWHIPHGIPLPPPGENVRRRDGRLRLAYCNRLQQYQKRVFDLPEIAVGLRKREIPFLLTIAGDGPDSAGLRRKFADFGLQKEIIFRGRIANEEVLNLVRDSHCFLLTSDFEGLPISLLEAMSTGCVPVAYRTPSGIAEAIEHGQSGMLVSHGNIESFVSTLEKLSQDSEMLEELAGNAAARVAGQFALTRMCAEYDAMFEQVCLEKETDFRIARTNRVLKPLDLKLRSRAYRWVMRHLQSSC
ncbi:MAG: glycosyltransferase family 4 protein [Verrucomicrobiota bacterium]